MKIKTRDGNGVTVRYDGGVIAFSDDPTEIPAADARALLATRPDLIEHVTASEPSEDAAPVNKFGCDVCDWNGKTSAALKGHKTREHAREKVAV